MHFLLDHCVTQRTAMGLRKHALQSTLSRKNMIQTVFLSAHAHAQARPYSAPVDGSIPASKQKYVPTSGTYPKGFSISGVHVGVKPSNTRFPDLALLVSDQPCSAAAVFTSNKFPAAPVVVSKQTLSEHRERETETNHFRAIVINSGCANAVTGKKGVEDAKAMASAVDAALSAPDTPSSTLVMSTGVIGQPLPINKILDAIPAAHSALSSTHDSWLTAARAICTTDTFPKLLSTTFNLPTCPEITYSLVGLAKGAGMIHPNMATLLGVMATDVPIGSGTLHNLLMGAVRHSFNKISIDGDTSTNDTVAILANGAAGGSLDIEPPDGKDFLAFHGILMGFAQKLSQLVVRDGEGATKFVHVRVTKAFEAKGARHIARTVAKSPLVKTALYGRDANWGRIVCAVGNTVPLNFRMLNLEKLNVSFVPKDGSMPLRFLKEGMPMEVDEERAAEILKDEDLTIEIELNTGDKSGEYWFSDFSHEYVTINADYRT